MRKIIRPRGIAALLIVVAMVAADASARAETVFYQNDFTGISPVSNTTTTGICAAAATINSFLYLLDQYPDVYGGTNLIPDWNNDGVLTQSDYVTSRDKIAKGWTYGGNTRTGMYGAGNAKAVWETTYYWLQDFAPDSTLLEGTYYTNDLIHTWAGGETIESSYPWYPRWDYLWDSVSAGEGATVGLWSMTGSLGHAVTLAGLAFDDLDGDGLWDTEETPQKIGFLDPNKTSQITWADVNISFMGRIEFTWWQDSQDYFVYRAFTETPISSEVPEPAILTSLSTLLLFGFVQLLRRKQR